MVLCPYIWCLDTDILQNTFFYSAKESHARLKWHESKYMEEFSFWAIRKNIKKINNIKINNIRKDLL